MGLFSLYSSKSTATSESHHAGGLGGTHRQPDNGGIDRPVPIGGPKPEERKRRRMWTRSGIRDFVGGLKRGAYGHLSAKSAAAIGEVVQEGSGANQVFNSVEVDDTAGTIVDEHLKLGLTTSQAEQVAREFGEGPKS